jgi:LysR family transcriptional regulator, glycine cleavage system transcriptional activator
MPLSTYERSSLRIGPLGQGIGIFSNVLVAPELASGMLVKAFNLSLPGYRFYIVRRQGHPREKIIRIFSAWLRAAK